VAQYPGVDQTARPTRPTTREEDPGMAEKKITPKAASAKDKQSGDRAAARVSLKRTHKQTTKKTTKRTHKKI
jgi:hypothetical protein